MSVLPRTTASRPRATDQAPPNRDTLNREAVNRLLRWGLRPGSAAAVTFAVCCVMVALGVRLLFWLFRPDLAIFATYYPAVLLATVIGGWRAGMVAQVLGGIAAWLFFDPSFTPPAQAFGDQIGDFALYGLSSGLIIWACEHYRRLIRRLDEEEHYRRLVVDELNHRLRNKLAVVHAILRHELRGHEDIRTGILERLQGAGRSRRAAHAAGLGGGGYPRDPVGRIVAIRRDAHQPRRGTMSDCRRSMRRPSR